MKTSATRFAFRSTKVFFVAFFLALFLSDGIRMLLFTSPSDRISHFLMRFWVVVVGWRAFVFELTSLVMSLCHFLAAMQVRRASRFVPEYPRRWSVGLGLVSAALFLLFAEIEIDRDNPMASHALGRMSLAVTSCFAVAYLPSWLGLRYLTRTGGKPGGEASSSPGVRS